MTKDFIQLTQLVNIPSGKETSTGEIREFELHIRVKDIKLFWTDGNVTFIEFYDYKIVKVKEHINVLSYSLGSSLI